MRIVTVKLPERYVSLLDELVTEKIYNTRSDAIRTAIKKLLIEMGKISSEQEDEMSAFPEMKATEKNY